MPSSYALPALFIEHLLCELQLCYMIFKNSESTPGGRQVGQNKSARSSTIAPQIKWEQ